MSTDTDTDLSKVFAALSDPIRRDMIARLALGDCTATELFIRHSVTKQAGSKHLRVLEECGLVSRPTDAYRKPVHLEADVLAHMTEWIERYRNVAAERYDRLDSLLATPLPKPNENTKGNSHERQNTKHA